MFCTSVVVGSGVRLVDVLFFFFLRVWQAHCRV